MQAGATGAGQGHLRNAAWCERENNAKRSFRRAGAAQEGSHVGFVFVDGNFEGSAAASVPRGDVRFGVDEEFCNFCATPKSRPVEGGASIPAAAGVRQRRAGKCVMVRMIILNIIIIAVQFFENTSNYMSLPTT